MHRPAREIDYEALMPKRLRRDKSLSAGVKTEFKTRTEKRDQFFEQYELYKEDQLQQKERTQLYSVLESMFEEQKKSPASDSTSQFGRAQEHIREYFSKPENTYFFDKNKMR